MLGADPASFGLPWPPAVCCHVEIKGGRSHEKSASSRSVSRDHDGIPAPSGGQNLTGERPRHHVPRRTRGVPGWISTSRRGADTIEPSEGAAGRLAYDLINSGGANELINAQRPTVNMTEFRSRGNQRIYLVAGSSTANPTTPVMFSRSTLLGRMIRVRLKLKWSLL